MRCIRGPAPYLSRAMRRVVGDKAVDKLLINKWRCDSFQTDGRLAYCLHEMLNLLPLSSGRKDFVAILKSFCEKGLTEPLLHCIIAIPRNKPFTAPKGAAGDVFRVVL